MLGTGLTRIVVPESAPYASLKGAIDVFTPYLAKELGHRRITVNTVAPGAIQSGLQRWRSRSSCSEQDGVRGYGLGRPELPDDVGLMIASLLSEDHRCANAQRIEVSGGQAISA